MARESTPFPRIARHRVMTAPCDVCGRSSVRLAPRVTKPEYGNEVWWLCVECDQDCWLTGLLAAPIRPFDTNDA